MEEMTSDRKDIGSEGASQQATCPDHSTT